MYYITQVLSEIACRKKMWIFLWLNCHQPLPWKTCATTSISVSLSLVTHTRDFINHHGTRQNLTVMSVLYIYIYFCLSFTADLTFKVFLNLVTSDSSSSAARDNLLKCCVLPTDLSEPVSLSPRSSSQLIDSNRKGRIAHLQLKGCSSSLGRKTQCCLKLKTTRTHPPPHTYSEKPVFEHARTDHSFRASQWRSVSVYPHLCAVYRLPTCVFRWLPVWPCHVKYPSPACRPERNSNFALHVCVCVCVCVCVWLDSWPACALEMKISSLKHWIDIRATKESGFSPI